MSSARPYSPTAAFRLPCCWNSRPRRKWWPGLSGSSQTISPVTCRALSSLPELQIGDAEGIAGEQAAGSDFEQGAGFQHGFVVAAGFHQGLGQGFARVAVGGAEVGRPGARPGRPDRCAGPRGTAGRAGRRRPSLRAAALVTSLWQAMASAEAPLRRPAFPPAGPAAGRGPGAAAVRRRAVRGERKSRSWSWRSVLCGVSQSQVLAIEYPDFTEIDACWRR